MKNACVLGCLILLTLSGCGHSQDSSGFQAWVADPHQHVYYGSFGRDLELREVRSEGGRNEWVIAQLAVRSPIDLEGLTVEVSDCEGPQNTILSRAIRLRYPDFLPVDENGQWTPDALRNSPTFQLRSNQSQPIWMDLQIPEGAPPGEFVSTITITHGNRSLAEFQWTIEVLDFTLPPIPDDHFYFNILMDIGSIARLHGVERWSEKHWELTQKYVENWAQHSQDAVTLFLIEDPWEGDTGFPVAGILEWQLDGKWEDLEAPEFQFGYANFDRFVQMCLDAGIDQNVQCWSPVMMPHRDYSVITYLDTAAGEIRKVRLEAGNPDYARAWSQFAGSFEQHLRQNGWLDLTTVGLDELSTENLDKIVPIFRQIAPDLQLMVSGGDEKAKYSDFSPEMAFHFGYVGSEVPLPDPVKRRSEGKRTLFYTANTPLFPNTFLFSQPQESRTLPWLVWKYDFDGYIRWAWNFWFDGFWDQPQYKWHSGDMFFVYPGEDGPLDSIRSEMFRKGAQDYECLWMIRDRLRRLREDGHSREVQAFEDRLAAALEEAIQQVDPVRPHRPLPSDLTKARHELNQILLNLKDLSQ